LQFPVDLIHFTISSRLGKKKPSACFSISKGKTHHGNNIPRQREKRKACNGKYVINSNEYNPIFFAFLPIALEFSPGSGNYFLRFTHNGNMFSLSAFKRGSKDSYKSGVVL